MNLKRILPLFFFFFAFLYMIFFTIDIPIFFEGREMFAGLVQQPAQFWIFETFLPGSTNPLGSTGELDGLLAWVLYLLFGYNEPVYRIAKALFFGVTMLIIFHVAQHIMRRSAAFLAVSTILFSFPLFLHTIVFDELFIYAEVFKLATVLLIIKDKGKHVYKTLFGIIAYAFMTIRFYHPAASVLGLIAAVALCERRGRYLIPIIFLLLFLVPRDLSETHLASPAYAPKIHVFNSFFITGFIDTVLHPLPHFTSLYHRSFWSVVTAPGILLLIFAIVLAFAVRIHFSTFFTRLLTYWIISEIPIFLFLPEVAIRYVSGILIPSVLLLFYILDQSLKKIQKKHYVPVFVIICLLTCPIILTNLAYTTVFRTTWGSGFIAADHVITYLQNKNASVTVSYVPMQVAPDFVPLNTKTTPYTIDSRLKFIRASEREDVNYTIQRVTSAGNMFPNTVSGTRETEIHGTNENSMPDQFFSLLRKIAHLPPNKMRVFVQKRSVSKARGTASQ